MKKEKRNPTLFEALIPITSLVLFLGIGIILYGSDPHVPMFLGIVVACLMSYRLGFTWKDLEESMAYGIIKALGSLLILIVIGILIGVWIDSGVVPSMIYYGLKILHPAIFLPASLIICSIVSLATGASWGTIATIGIALMGVGYGLEIPAPITAGAIISGSYFGDKMSPLSDTTNLAPSIAGTDLMTHIRFMMKPTIIAYVLSLIAFLIVGLFYVNNIEADLSKVLLFENTLKDLFEINYIYFIPPLTVLLALIFKIPALPGIALGTIIAAIIGLIFQNNCNLSSLFIAGMNGFSCNTGVDDIDLLLNSGGIKSMMHSVSMIIIAMAYGGIMEKTNQFRVIVSKLKSYTTTPFKLVFLTQIICIISNILVPEQYVSIVIPGSMLSKEYEELNLSPETLSNALESSGTVTSVLIPWNTCGVYVSQTLGIATFLYIPWCFFNLLMPIVQTILAYLGITIKRKIKENK